MSICVYLNFKHLHLPLLIGKEKKKKKSTRLGRTERQALMCLISNPSVLNVYCGKDLRVWICTHL